MKPLAIATLIAAAATIAAAQVNYDLIVHDKTLVQRCVLKGADSSRIVAVGHPGGFNYAFDAVNCAPISTWSGGFIDFKGEVTGRGGNGSKALGVQRTLGADTVPFRVGSPDALPKTLSFRGYRRDAVSGNPTFLFQTDGVSVEQRIVSDSPDKVTLELAFPGKSKQPKFYRIDPTPHVQIALGDGLRWSGPGVIEIPAAQSSAALTIQLKSSGKAFVREVEKLSGADMFRNFCSSCHSTDGSKLIGPTFQGLWGREVSVTRDGSSQILTVDAAYLRESIVKPQAAIVKGYEAVPMADFSAVLTPQQIDDLVAYLKELGSAHP